MKRLLHTICKKHHTSGALLFLFKRPSRFLLLVILNATLLAFNVQAQQTFTTYQPANLVVGQSTFGSTTYSTAPNGLGRPAYTAISSKGMLAVVDQASGYLRIWKNGFTSNGQTADIIIPVGGADGVAFSPDGNMLFVSRKSQVLVWRNIPINNLDNYDYRIFGFSYAAGIYVSTQGELVVADLSANRVLIWNRIPTTNTNTFSANVVVGQPNMSSAIPGSGLNQLQSPWGVWVDNNGKLLIADHLNNRVLIYNQIPTTNGASANVVLGGFGGTSANRFSIPIGVTVSPDGKLAIGEFSNNRVLIYNSVPTTSGASADVVLGQPNFTTSYGFYPSGIPTNRNMLRPYNVAFDLYGRLFVVGREMNRALVFGSLPTQQAELAVSMTSNKTTVSRNEEAVAIVTITNNGPNTATNVIATASYPTAFNLQSHTASTGTYNTTSGYWNIPSIASGASVTLTLSGQVPVSASPGTYTGAANILQSNQLDNNQNNNAAGVTFTILANNSPAIAGTVASQATTDKSTLSPFSTVSLSDPENSTLAVSIGLDAATKGVFTTASLTASGFADAGGGTYTFNGLPAAATTAIRTLVFQPTENRVTVGNTETTTFSLTISDGSASEVDNTTTVISTSANDAPIVDNSGTPLFPSVAEDATAPTGTTVATLLGGITSDVDLSSIVGGAITAIDNTQGQWQYSIDGGTNWNDLTAALTTSALLLENDDQLRFIPSLNYNGTIDPAITLHAWDRTTGTAGSTVDISTNGGTTAYSAAAETFTLMVTPVNDVPTISTIAVQNIPENGNTSALAFIVGDVETAAGSLTVTASSNNTTLIPVSGIVLGGTDANRTVTITPTASSTGTAEITLTVSDGTTADDQLSTFTVNVLPNISINDVAVNEDAGTLDFTVSLSNPGVVFPLTVDYTTNDDTALNGTDYTTTNGTLTINSTATTTQTISVPITDNSILQLSRSFNITLSNPNNAYITDGLGVGTINDEDNAAVTIADVDGDENGGDVTVTLALDNAVQGGFTVDVNTADGTATTGDSDYTAVTSETITFAGTASETQTFTITPTGDTKVELNETVGVSMNNLAATTLGVVITDNATVTINNDDAAAITIEDVEGEEDAGAITLTATLNNEVQDGLTVEVNTANGTATVTDGDYGAVNAQVLTFTGTTNETQTFTVTPTADTKLETNETVSVSMATLSPTALNVDITDVATVTINNDDNAAVTIADANGNEDDGAITLTLTLDNAVQGGFEVDVNTADGTATTGDSDYTAVTGQTLAFAGTASETHTFTITPTGDTKLEADETLGVSMNNLASTTLAVNISDGATITIHNDDNAPPTDISLSPRTIFENQSVGTAIGTFVTTDPDIGDVHTYTLVTGTLPNDNAFFQIAGSTLQTNAVFDYESKNSFTIRVRSTDAGGLSVERNFEIRIEDVDEIAPRVISMTFIESPTNVENHDLTLEFSEFVSGLTVNDFTVEGGFISNLTGSGTTYNFSLTMTEEGPIKVFLRSGAVSDAVGNFSAATTLIYTIYDNSEPTTPTVTVEPEITNQSTVTITLTFDEVIEGLDENDLEITNGTIKSISTEDGKTFVVEVIPENDGEVAITIPSGATTDEAGNDIPTIDFNFLSDRTPPTVTFTSIEEKVTNKEILEVIVTFSEKVTGIDKNDFEVENGFIIGVSTEDGINYTIEIAPVGDGEVKVNLKSQSYADVAGNKGEPAENTFSVVSDQTTPEITLATEKEHTAESPILITVNTSEPIEGLDAEDFAISNATVQRFDKVSDTSYELWILPEQGEITITLANNSAQDVAGNVAAGSTLTVFHDNIAPLLTWEGPTGYTNQDELTFVLTLSEAVDNLTMSDLVYDNARLTSFRGEGTERTITIEPLSEGIVGISIPAGAISDKAGNENEEAATSPLVYDSTQPTVTLSAESAEFSAEAIQVTLLFSEEIEGLEASEITVIGANTTSLVAGNTPNTYILTLEPTSEGDIAVSVSAGVATDKAGNENEASQETLALRYDVTAPTAVLSTTVESATATLPWSVMLRLSEEVTGLTMESFNIVNATVNTLEQVDALTYQLSITPTQAGALSVQLKEGVVEDRVGNVNTASNILQLVYNQLPERITLSTTTIAENEPEGTLVGTLSTVDADQNDTHTYALVSGNGSDDNDVFTIDGDKLLTQASFDFETKQQYSIRVSSTDPQGGQLESVIEISVEDVFEGKSISGTILNTLNYSAVIVELIKKQENGTQIVNETSLSSEGSYHFEGLGMGEYTVRVLPQQTGFVPTYLGNQLLRANAVYITLSEEDAENNDVTVLTIPSSSPLVGEVVLNGVVKLSEDFDVDQLPENTETNAGDALPNATVYITNPANGDLLAVTITNEEGEFYVEGLVKATTYELQVDYAGKLMHPENRFISLPERVREVSVTLIVGNEFVEVEVNQVTALEALVIENNIQVFPNPAIDKTTLALEGSIRGELFIQLYDLQGKLFNVEKVEKQENRLEKSIELHGLPTGVYLIKVSHAQQQWVFKVQKTN